MFVVICYIIYLVISLGVTIWVAQTLHRNGRAFLVDAFHNNADLADSVNHLLVVGFYLINLGYIALAMRTQALIETERQAVELIFDKIGVVLLVLGVMHFFNMWVFNKLRMRGRARQLPPTLPGGWAADAPIGKVLD